MNLAILAAYCENERYIWCIVDSDTYLYKLDRTRCVMEQVVPLSEDIYMQRAYKGILPYRNSLIFIPASAEHIVIVDCRHFTKEYIELPKMKYQIGKSTNKFLGGVVYEDSLFLFGHSYPGIVKVDLISKEVKVIDFWLNESMIIFTNEDDGCFSSQYVILNNVVYFPFVNANAVLQFDLVTEDVFIHNVGDDKQRYISIVWDGTCFWLIPRDGSIGSIIKWNPANGVTEYYSNYPEQYNYEVLAFYNTEIVEDKIFIFASKSNCNICIDINTGQMETFPHLYCVENINGCKYPVVWQEHGKFVALRDKEWAVWGYNEKILERFEYELGSSITQRYYEHETKKYFENRSQDVKRENERFNLNDYLKYLTLKQSNRP